MRKTPILQKIKGYVLKKHTLYLSLLKFFLKKESF